MDEIVQKEGVACPVLRGEQLLEPSPFSHGRSGSFVVRRKRRGSGNLQSHAELTMSLPNLLDIDNIENPPPANRHSVFIPVYVGCVCVCVCVCVYTCFTMTCSFRANASHGVPTVENEHGFHDDDILGVRADSPESYKPDRVTSNEDHVITQSDLVTSSNVPGEDSDVNPDHPLKEEDWQSEFMRLCQVLRNVLSVYCDTRLREFLGTL